MGFFDFDNIESSIFTIEGITNKVKADKLFVSLLIEIEEREIDIRKDFTLEEISELIPRGTAGVSNYSTYGFSIMSMLSNQKERDYFLFNNHAVQDEFTTACNDANRDNYLWKKKYSKELVRINPIYILANDSDDSVAGKNEKKFAALMESIYGKEILKGKCTYKSQEQPVSISVDNTIRTGKYKVLIEVDSGNMAKLIVGQYTLLNELCHEKEDVDILFLVIHYYKDYNPQRTINNLNFINTNIYGGKGLKYKVFSISEFEKLCRKNTEIEKLVKCLYHDKIV